jgi:hypothetical protein
MNSTFDPYQAWLGIPPAEQPAHHYRLLGLALWENRWDVIDATADRQMAILRQHESGEMAAIAKRLLTELAAAKVCLLSPRQRSNYDAQLRRQLDSAGHGPAGNFAARRGPSSRTLAGYVSAAVGIAILIAIISYAMHCCCTTSGTQGQGSSTPPVPTAPRDAGSHGPS